MLRMHGGAIWIHMVPCFDLFLLLKWLVQNVQSEAREWSPCPHGSLNHSFANVFHGDFSPFSPFGPDRRCGAELSSSSPVRGDPAAQAVAGLWN